MTNQYGLKFEEGKTYSIPQNIALTKGVQGTGYHYTPYLEDTLRYVDGMLEKIKIAKVTAANEIITFDDEYNGYYDISATRELTINHILTRQEIIDHILTRHDLAVVRFLQGYKLTEEELTQIKTKFKNNISINLAIDYYQYDDKDAYKKFSKKWRAK